MSDAWVVKKWISGVFVITWDQSKVEAQDVSSVFYFSFVFCESNKIILKKNQWDLLFLLEDGITDLERGEFCYAIGCCWIATVKGIFEQGFTELCVYKFEYCYFCY